jgi:hypothetical protein
MDFATNSGKKQYSLAVDFLSTGIPIAKSIPQSIQGTELLALLCIWSRKGFLILLLIKFHLHSMTVLLYDIDYFGGTIVK